MIFGSVIPSTARNLVLLAGPFPRNKKGAPCGVRLGNVGKLGRSDHVHLAVGLVELDGAVAEREERPIAADAHALAGVVLRTALADDDAAGEDLLAAKKFDAEALRRAVATVAGGFLTCFMCHDSG